MTLWTNPTGENSIQAKWEIGKTAPANMISLWEQIQMWKWPPAEIRNGRRTCLVIQLGNCGIFRTFFCRICILRHGWGQFTITCHRCSAIFLQDQPLFSNFPLFEVLETQLTFKSVGEPDYVTWYYQVFKESFQKRLWSPSVANQYHGLAIHFQPGKYYREESQQIGDGRHWKKQRCF